MILYLLNKVNSSRWWLILKGNSVQVKSAFKKCILLRTSKTSFLSVRELIALLTFSELKAQLNSVKSAFNFFKSAFKIG